MGRTGYVRSGGVEWMRTKYSARKEEERRDERRGVDTAYGHYRSLHAAPWWYSIYCAAGALLVLCFYGTVRV